MSSTKSNNRKRLLPKKMKSRKLQNAHLTKATLFSDL